MKFVDNNGYDIPVKEIIEAVLEYQYKGIKENPDIEGREMNRKYNTPQYHQKVYYRGNSADFVHEFEEIGVWEDYPKLYHDTSLVVNLGSYAYTTKGGLTIYFKKISEMSNEVGYYAFTPPSWDAEKKRYCGTLHLSYGGIDLYVVEEIDGKLVCTSCGFYKS